ncbi:uncharacterized protein [Trachinotus anak]|uniref:uncharacterized protein isoform X1 n=1 Tax=Trachinotus anak TaxID=443729 RepID=UPI0039F2112F
MSTAAYQGSAAVAKASGMAFVLNEAIRRKLEEMDRRQQEEKRRTEEKRREGEREKQRKEKSRRDQKRERLGLGFMVVIGVAFLAFLVGNSRIKKVSHYDTSHYDTSHYETNQYETNHHETSQYETCQYETNHHETNHPPSGVIRLGLINARSINNKRCLIPEVITENNLSVLCITETWTRNDTADKVLRECLPPDFGCYNVSRNRKGGGAAVLFSKVFCSEQKEFGFITTFEYVATVLHHRQWDKPILLINVYRPPGYKKFKDFLSEFQMLLNEVQGSNLVVTGDFNIRVDRVEDRYAKLLEELLQRNDLDQYVNSKTHQKGGTLDLVISRNVEISDVHVSNELISDHYPVFFNAKPVSKNTGKKIKDDRDEDEQGKRFKKCEE